MDKKQKIIGFICEMDIEKLKPYLTSKVYEGYNNSTFLNNLNKVFNRFQNGGDTYLKVHKTKGSLNSKKVFWFVGNKSNNFFNFSYEESTETYFNFSSSHWAKMDNKSIILNDYFCVCIKKPRDTLEYRTELIKNEPIQQYFEICSKGICSMSSIANWINKYMDWYGNNEKGIHKIYTDFITIRERLYYLYLIHSRENQFKQLIKKYNESKYDEQKLSEWIKFQKTFNVKIQCLADVIFMFIDDSLETITFDDLKVSKNDFQYVLMFLELKKKIESNKTYQKSQEWTTNTELARSINHKYFLWSTLNKKNGFNR